MKQRIRPTIRVIVIVNTILFLEGSVEYLKKNKKKIVTCEYWILLDGYLGQYETVWYLSYTVLKKLKLIQYFPLK